MNERALVWLDQLVASKSAAYRSYNALDDDEAIKLLVFNTSRFYARRPLSPLRPDRRALVAHLESRLDAGSERRVTLIVAPAGYSKSTTVAQWLSHADAPPAAWLSLDSLDNDLQRFCQYVVAALRQFVPGGLHRTEAFLTARHLPETELLADTLSVELEELDQRVEELADELVQIPLTQLISMKLIVNQAYDNMGLQSTQTLGPILDGAMRNTREGREFVRLAMSQGVKAAVTKRDAPFGDYSQGRPEDQPRKKSELANE